MPGCFWPSRCRPTWPKPCPAVAKAVREVVDGRPFTMIFDRGGYDGKLFSWLQTEDIGFITYERQPETARGRICSARDPLQGSAFSPPPYLPPYSPTVLAAFARNSEPSRMYRRSIAVPLCPVCSAMTRSGTPADAAEVASPARS